MALKMQLGAIAAGLLVLAGCGSSGGTTTDTLVAAAERAGLDVPAWQACRADPATAAGVGRDEALGSAAGVRGTPTFFLNGEPVVGAQDASVFRAAIQAARNRALSSGLSAADYYAESFPDLPVETSPVKGPADARVTILEFSDFECHFCVAVQGTLRTVLAEAGSDVRLVYKHFPISSSGRTVAIAAECARTQGRFWAFHDVLFGG